MLDVNTIYESLKKNINAIEKCYTFEEKNNMNILSLLITPIVAAILYLYLNKVSKNKYPFLVHSFIFGMFGIIIFKAFQYLAFSSGLDILTNIRRIIFYSFVIMGVGSELGKYLILRFFSYDKKDFEGPLDAIIYSVFIGLGFAFFANLSFYLFPYYGGYDSTYAFWFTFANILFSVVLGFFVGLAKTRSNSFVDSMVGLTGAAFFNAIFNFSFITRDMKLMYVFLLGALVIAIILIYRAIVLRRIKILRESA